MAEAVGHRGTGAWIFGRGWHQEKWGAAGTGRGGLPDPRGPQPGPADNPCATHASGPAASRTPRRWACPESAPTTDNPRGVTSRGATRIPPGLPGHCLAPGPHGPRGAHPRGRHAPPARFSTSPRESCRSADLLSGRRLAVRRHRAVEAVVDDGKLNVRLWIMLRVDNARSPGLRQSAGRLRPPLPDRGRDQRSIDGALGPHGAWLMAPTPMNSSRPGTTPPRSTVRETAELAMKHGYQLCVHAIGDRANRETLNLFEDALQATDRRTSVGESSTPST